MRNHITAERLNELVLYNRDTGVFTSKIARGNIKKGDVIGRDNGRGYLRFCVDGVDIAAHRAAFIICHGYAPDYIDHINGMRGDNRICNLREATINGNNRNCSKKHYSRSRFKGISLHKKTKKWQAQIRNGGKLIALGYFKSEVEAAYAYDMASLFYHGDFGKRNFLPLA